MNNNEQPYIQENAEAQAAVVARGQVLRVADTRNTTFIGMGLPGEAVPVQVAVRGGLANPPHIGDIIETYGTLGETELSKRRGLGQSTVFADSYHVAVYCRKSSTTLAGS